MKSVKVAVVAISQKKKGLDKAGDIRRKVLE